MIIAALIHAAGMAAVMVFIVYYVLKGNKGRNRLFTTLGVLIFVVVSYVYGRNYIHLAIDKGGITWLIHKHRQGIFIYGNLC